MSRGSRAVPFIRWSRKSLPVQQFNSHTVHKSSIATWSIAESRFCGMGEVNNNGECYAYPATGSLLN